MKCFIFTGGKSFIGSAILKSTSFIEVKNRINSMDDLAKIQKDFNISEGDVVINCIGHTGNPNIDSCEASQEAKDKTYHSNVVVPMLINSFCNLNKIKMIHISSGCIYYGYTKNGWSETDTTTPLSFYSKTKYECENNLTNNVLILRIRMPMSSTPDQRNLITKLLKYNKLIDAKNSMTFVDDLIAFINYSNENKLTGIFNVVNDPPLSAAEIVSEYNKQSSAPKAFDIISIDDLDAITVAKRSNCILNTGKISSYFKMLDSRQRLIETIKHYILEERKINVK